MVWVWEAPSVACPGHLVLLQTWSWGKCRRLWGAEPVALPVQLGFWTTGCDGFVLEHGVLGWDHLFLGFSCPSAVVALLASLLQGKRSWGSCSVRAKRCFSAAEDSVNAAVLAMFQLDLVSRRQKSFSLQQLSGLGLVLLLLSALESVRPGSSGCPRRITHPGLHWDGGTLAPFSPRE